MIKINQLRISVNSSDEQLKNKIRHTLKLAPDIVFSYTILKKSIDARKKDNLLFVYSLAVQVDSLNENAIVKKLASKDITIFSEEKYLFPNVNENAKHKKVAIVGLGPAGLFSGLMLARAGIIPEIFERGSSIHERTEIVNKFFETGILDTQTNVQFGEGGAGTFSDGKLNSVIKEKNGRIKKVLETFVEFGASPEILYSAKPHVGTDVLALIVERIRNEIINLGGIVHFNSKVTDIFTDNNKVCGLEINNTQTMEFDTVILAIGHSARDTFTLLCNKNIPMEKKDFAIGLRVEHPQSLINEYAYGTNNLNNLPVADYKVTAKTSTGRGVYSFCMCPGGYVVNASSEEKRTCVNGMSYSKRDGKNANSAIVVTISSDDFSGNEILSGMHFQRRLEENAYIAGNGGVPYQLNEDFIRGNKTTSCGSVTPQILGKKSPANLREVLPPFICESIIDGMKSFDKIIHGFNMPEAVFSGIESRTSSPVRILRNDAFESVAIKGLYPCGEGAGYAGGITSAAVDGIKVAEAIATS